VRKGPIGLFDVYADEFVIYSNRREGGRLPKNQEVLQRIRDFLSLPAQPKKGRATGKGPATAAPESQCSCG
jgi:predicted Rdx family selenoprotein